MLSFFAIVHIVKIILLATTLILALLYISLTIVTQGLRTSINVLMINVCVACTICSCFWIIYNILEMIHSPLMRYDELCWFYSYAQNVSVCQVVYAFCAVSLNRYLIVVYSNNIYFKRRRWALICALIQWFISGLLPTPLWSSKTCGQFGIPWGYQLYKVFVVVIIPTVFTLVLNGILFMFIHKSTTRIQPTGNRNRLGSRDARLLKHMIFVIVVYVCAWAPIYIAALADVAHSFPSIIYGILNIPPNFGLLIGTIDLFLYDNHLKRICTRSTTLPLERQSTAVHSS